MAVRSPATAEVRQTLTGSLSALLTAFVSASRQRVGPTSRRDLNPRLLRAHRPALWHCGEHTYPRLQPEVTALSLTGAVAAQRCAKSQLTPAAPRPLRNTRGLDRPQAPAMAQRPARLPSLPHSPSSSSCSSGSPRRAPSPPERLLLSAAGRGDALRFLAMAVPRRRAAHGPRPAAVPAVPPAPPPAERKGLGHKVSRESAGGGLKDGG